MRNLVEWHQVSGENLLLFGGYRQYSVSSTTLGQFQVTFSTHTVTSIEARRRQDFLLGSVLEKSS